MQFSTRTVLLVLCVVLVALSGVQPAAGEDTGTLQQMEGEGTEEDPYVITNAEELQTMNDDLGAHYVLGDDIDASDTATWNEGDGFEPVGTRLDTPFSGTLDGQGHEIRGLTISRPEDTGVGLFGSLSGRVEEVHLRDVDVSGHDRVGGLVGESFGTVESSSVTGSVRGTFGITGGLVGIVEGTEATVLRSWSAADVSSDGTTGGLVSDVGDEARVRLSYASGTVDGAGPVGGLVGRVGRSRTSVSASYTIATVSGEGATGGIAGEVLSTGYADTAFAAGEVANGDGTIGSFEDQNNVQDFYWDVDATGQSSGHGTGLDSAEITGDAAAQNLDGFDFENFWAVTDAHPVLRWQVDRASLSLSESVLTPENTTTATARLHLTDGTSRPVTAVASYESADDGVATVADDGTVTAESEGRTELTARHAGVEATASVLVISPEGVSAIGAEVDASEVQVGETVTVTGTFRNVDENATEHEATLTVDGEAVATETIEVAGGADEEYELEWTPEEAGEYELDIDALSAGSVTVTEPSDDGSEGDGESGSGESGSDDDGSDDGSSSDILLLSVGAVLVILVGVGAFALGQRQ